MTEQLVGTILSTGVVGAFCVLLLLALKRKDEALDKEKEGRLEDAKSAAKVIIDLNSKVLVAVDSLGDLATRLEKEREQERWQNQAKAPTRAGTR